MSLKIALVGYGQMGKDIYMEALKKGHTCLLTVDQENRDDWKKITPNNIDVIIEFTQPESALKNYRQLIPLGVPIVTGTTGWSEHFEEIKALVAQHNGSFLYSSNFSIGVNMLFKINSLLAEMMNDFTEYDPFIEERHHRHKKDAPSGTALSLARELLEKLDRKHTTVSASLEQRAPLKNELSVSYSRAGSIFGEHVVSYHSDIDRITIQHEAFSRKGFSLGAIRAAEWLSNKRGFYNFADIF